MLFLAVMRGTKDSDLLFGQIIVVCGTTFDNRYGLNGFRGRANKGNLTLRLTTAYNRLAFESTTAKSPRWMHSIREFRVI